ncbi:MAG: hypothetical protein OXH85_00355, partial [Truepera sp.]|nr:hypothetical protein [Truepera sp.]
SSGKLSFAMARISGERSRTPAEVFYGESVKEEEDLKERRCSDQPVLVSYGEVQESHLIVA